MMEHSNRLYKALGINPRSRAEHKDLAKKAEIPLDVLRYYNERDLLPVGAELLRLCNARGLPYALVMLRMGIIDGRLTKAIQGNADAMYKLLAEDLSVPATTYPIPPLVFQTGLGQLYQGDCLALMRNLDDEQFDVIFADPPFNLKKLYPSGIDDNLKHSKYIEWTEDWLRECVRLLKPGGSFFVWNIPRWGIHIGAYLNKWLTFRHWVSSDIKYSLPIAGRLYPSHYCLLYYSKGSRPNVFHPDRLPMEVCPKCKADLRDYGGYKDKMNPRGVNLTDVWYDISPVRHEKYKRRKNANELSIKLLDRVIELASNPGDTIFDPFGGSGTTYIVAELKGRKWVGTEMGPTDEINARFVDIENERRYLDNMRRSYNKLFTEETSKARVKRGLWTCESVRKASPLDELF